MCDPVRKMLTWFSRYIVYERIDILEVNIKSKGLIDQNRSMRLKPDEASKLFSIVLGVKSRLFSLIVNLVLVFFFFWVIEGVISCRGDRISFLLIFKGVLR